MTLVRRDREGKSALGLDGAASAVAALLDEIQIAMLTDARQRRDAATTDVARHDEIDGSGFFRIPWPDLGLEGEQRLAERGYTVRCLLAPDGGIPEPDATDLVAYVARSY